jgi:hypothetical protein
VRSTGGNTWRTLLREAAPHLGLEEDKKDRGLAAHMRLLTLKLRDNLGSRDLKLKGRHRNASVLVHNLNNLGGVLILCTLPRGEDRCTGTEAMLSRLEPELGTLFNSQRLQTVKLSSFPLSDCTFFLIGP